MNSYRWPAGAALVLALPVMAWSAPPVPMKSASGSTVVVTVTDLRNAKGVVRACMTALANKFPRCRGSGFGHNAIVRAVTDAGGHPVLRFDGVKPGRYAIAVLHDENENGRADRALSMMPTEGFGFSRDAKVRMGPPKFDDAAFDVEFAQTRHSIRMRYLF